MPSRSERFWEKVDKGELNECWEWLGAKQSKGYGNFCWSYPRYTSAHRAAYTLTHGEIPDGMWVLHHCDNRGCVNPRHLYVGEAADNTQDMVDRGRHVPHDFGKGEHHPNAKLTEDDVTHIRAAPKSTTNKELAEGLGVDPSTVSKARNGETWRHL